MFSISIGDGFASLLQLVPDVGHVQNCTRQTSPTTHNRVAGNY